MQIFFQKIVEKNTFFANKTAKIRIFLNYFALLGITRQSSGSFLVCTEENRSFLHSIWVNVLI